MSKKSLVLTLVAHEGYFKSSDANAMSLGMELFFSSITDTYIPLLNMFETLDLDNVPFKISLVLTPTLCALLSDMELQENYVQWLDKLIALGYSQIHKLQEEKSEKLKVAQEELDRIIKTRFDFVEAYKSNLLEAFKYYADRGSIELLATAATNAFLPHYIDLPEAINAQIECGLLSHKHFFGVAPDGFWLPAMGYTAGLESVLKNYGFSYTILDSHGVLFGDPTPVNGIFSPVSCKNGFKILAQDFTAEKELMGPGGYVNKEIYRDQNRDIAFEASSEELKGYLEENEMRRSSGYKYWKKGEVNATLLYEEDLAIKQAEKDAALFVQKYEEKLKKAEKTLGTDNVSLTCVFSAKNFGQNWFEGVYWLEQVIRKVAVSEEIILVTAYDVVDKKKDLQIVTPFLSAASGTGYGEDLLDTKNSWMLKYTRKACQRMNYMADRFADETGLKARALNMAAREVLLAQSLGWADMVHDGIDAQYAEEEFKKNILAFTTVFDALGANSISTEWLTKIEAEHSVFPWMNYRMFSKKQ